MSLVANFDRVVYIFLSFCCTEFNGRKSTEEASLIIRCQHQEVYYLSDGHQRINKQLILSGSSSVKSLSFDSTSEKREVDIWNLLNFAISDINVYTKALQNLKSHKR